MRRFRLFSVCLSLFFVLTPTLFCSEKTSTPNNAIYGIDISQYQGDLIQNLEKHHNKLSFIICKATEGASYTDPDFASNWKAIPHKHRIRGAYHFFHTSDDPILQADHYLNTVYSKSFFGKKYYDPENLPPIVAVEPESIKGVITPYDLHKNLLLFLLHIEKQTGRKPMIYTNLTFANQYLLNETFSEYPLWLADYSSKTKPTLPFAWRRKGYVIWQKTNSFSPYSLETDFDVFNGKLDDYCKLEK